jgi:hypothetical protein
MFHLMVEILQNISIHATKEDGVGKGIILIGRKDDHFVINAGNFMDSTKVEPFKKKLRVIDKLNKEELRELYKSTLVQFVEKHEVDSSLGLVGIARDCINHPDYQFTEIDEKNSFFSISVTV